MPHGPGAAAAPPATLRRRPGGAGGLQKSLPGRVAEVAAARPEEHVEVWFEDEARSGQKGTLTRVWAPRGSRPVAPEQTAYGNLHALTAGGRAEGLISPRLDADVVQVFLDGLSATMAAGAYAVPVWGGADYHVAKGLRVPANLTLVGLPPYSPELNPVERLWLSLREHHWSNRVYADVDAVESAAMSGWRAVCLDGAKIRSICRCEYLS